MFRLGSKSTVPSVMEEPQVAVPVRPEGAIVERMADYDTMRNYEALAGKLEEDIHKGYLL
jgi:hypothetical protein